MCTITITGIRGIESTPGAGPDEIEVRGTADDCTDVCVQIQQTNPVDIVTPEKTIAVDAAESWVATFRVADGDFSQGDFLCGSGNKAVVLAACCADPACDTQLDFADLDCGDCPAIGPVQADVSDRCNPDGTRTVTISFAVTPGPAGVAVVQVLNEDGLGPAAQTVTAPDTTVSVTLDVLPGQHQATVTVSFPVGCAGADVDFTVRECDVPVRCPEITFTTDQSACDDEDQRTVQVEAHVLLASGEAVTAQLLRVDATGNPIGAPLDTGTNAGGELTLAGSGTFPAGTTVRFRVEVDEPPGCPGATYGVDLPACADEEEPPPVVVEPPPVEEPPPEEEEPPVVVPPPVVIVEPPPECPWAWLLPAGLVLLVAGVIMTVFGGCTVNVPVAIGGQIAGLAGSLMLMAWGYACRDCSTMKALLLTGTGTFDVLAILAIILALNAQLPCAEGFMAGALLVALAAFSLGAPYVLLCGTECAPLRVALGILAGVFAALMLAALVVFIVGIVAAMPALFAAATVLVIIAMIVAAIALNFVLVPLLLFCA